MEEPPQKKRKCENCIVCNIGTTYQYNEKYTNFLISQLVPSTEKHKFSSSIIFSFCMNCIGVLDDLMELKHSLEFLVKRIENKKFELKCKIVQIKDDCGLTAVKDFREVATTSLRPRISMYKNNVLFPTKEGKHVATLLDNVINGPASNTKTDEKEISIVSAFPSPKSHENHLVAVVSSVDPYSKDNINSRNILNKQQPEQKTSKYTHNSCLPAISDRPLKITTLNLFREVDGELKINSQFADCKAVSKSISKVEEAAPETKCSKNQREVNDKYAEDVLLPSEYNERTENDPEIDIKSESLEMIDGEDGFEIHNWEELEKHSDEVFSSYPGNNIENDDNHCFLIGKASKSPIAVPVNATATLDDDPNKKWLKPLLTMQQLCYLALFYPNTTFKTSLEIADFLCENFPFFRTMKRYSLEPQIKNACEKNTYFSKYFDPQKLKTFYTVTSKTILKEKELIHKYLCTEDILTTMAFPGRVVEFQKALDPNVHFSCSVSTRSHPLERFPKTDYRDLRRSLDASAAENKLNEYVRNPETTLKSNGLKTVISTFLPETSDVYDPANLQTFSKNLRVITPPTVSSNEGTFNGYCESKDDQDDVTIVSDSLDSIPRDIVGTPAVQYVPARAVSGSTFTKPPITCEEICFCAIMNAESMLVSVADVLKFIRENFPLFYDSNIPDHLPISNIENTLCKAQFRLISRVAADSLATLEIIKPMETLFPYLYTIYDNPETYYWRKATAGALSSKFNIMAMAFPDRVYGFIKNVLTRNIVPDAYLYIFNNKQTHTEETVFCDESSGGGGMPSLNE